MSESWNGPQGRPDQHGHQDQQGHQQAWPSQPGEQGWSGQPGEQGWSGQPGEQGWSGQQAQQARSGPQGWSGQPSAAGPRSSGRRGPLLVGVAGGLVVAVLIGAVLLLTGAMSFGSGSDTAAVDSRPISLPEKLAGFTDKDTAADAKSQQGGDRRREITSRLYARTSQQYSAAYHGAGVGVRAYADADLQILPTVIAVRAPASGLTVGLDPDPADLGLAAPREQVVTEGDVQCVILNVENVTKGKEVDPDKQYTSICRRSNPSATVDVIGNARGPEGRKQVIALTNAAFAAVTGAAG